jgi:hydrogenase maturation protease
VILVAGVGNIFLGDDAFGSEVARALLARPVCEGVRVVDYGIRGFDLMYALLDDYESVVIMDVVARGGLPGTLYVIEPDTDETESEVDAHGMNPMRVLALGRSMGAKLEHVRIVGCEPESFGSPDEGRLGLSPRVRAAVGSAVEIVESLIQEALV